MSEPGDAGAGTGPAGEAERAGDGPAGELDRAIAELQRAADRLRDETLDPSDAADLVERCAELATRVGAELDALAAPDASPGQETLL